VGRPKNAKKMVFPAAIREKSRCWVVLAYDAHSVSAGLGRIRQSCFRSLSDWIVVRTFLKHLPFCAGNYINEKMNNTQICIHIHVYMYIK